MAEETNLVKETESLLDDYDEQVASDIATFNGLLDTLTTTEDRKKDLWKKIYHNALIDRRNAFLMYHDLVKSINKDPTQHAILGTHIAKYLERMSKANDQIIRLAEIVESKTDAIHATLTSNDNILDVIQSEKTKNEKKRKS